MGAVNPNWSSLLADVSPSFAVPTVLHIAMLVSHVRLQPVCQLSRYLAFRQLMAILQQ
jgi:hypothetical protein